jgi:diguanylate cyclase (GGDEF)-like protein/PAS domain S-box-containing protein
MTSKTTPARHSWARNHAWSLYVAAGALGTLLYLTVPPFSGSAPFMNMLGLTGPLAVLVGMRWHKPVSRLPWLCFVGGLSLFWLGDVYTYSYPKLLGHEVPFPSFGDALYILVYPALMLGLIVLVRRRNPRLKLGNGIDATIMTLGLALPSWTALIAPYVHDDAMSIVPKLVSVAYPLGDVLLLAAAVSLAMDSGRRRPAFYLLSTSILALLVTDFFYGLMLLHGTYDHQLSLDVGWIAFYIFWGATALHPSMRQLDRRSPDVEAKLTPVRLALLAGASLIAPTMELIDAIHAGDTDMIVVIGASVALFTLVVARMAGLVRQQERSVQRERVLGAAGASLVAATGREEIQRAALDSVRPLLEGPGLALLCRLGENGLSIADGPKGARELPLSNVTANELLELAAGKGRDGVRLAASIAAELELPADHTRAILLELRVRGDVRGLLLVARAQSTPEPVCRALASLATQLALALESAALTEEVHRRQSEARFASLVAHSSDLITVLGPDATVVYQSPSSERVLGYTPEELVGTRFDRLLVPGEEGRLLHLLSDGSGFASSDGEALECTLRHRDGSSRQFEILYTDLTDDEHVRGIVLNGRDVSERKRFEAQLAHQAFHDPVTGLPNRALFVDRVRHRIARTRRDEAGLAVIFLDLDDFKTINDSLGHAAGDEVLVAVAKRLATTIRASDTAARFGGDEFALLLEDVENVEEAADTAERIMEAVAQPLSLAGKELTVHCSMGISVLDGDEPTDADELIRDADAAMYIAKREGKDAYRLFEPAMHDGVMARLELRADLQRALTAGELELFYQPVVRLNDSSVIGVEALLRWRHPQRGLVKPDDFIPFAEETGLIVPMGRWVLREACRQAVELQRGVACDPPLTMSVNLSVKQLQHSDVVADVSDALAESSLDPTLLTLEITESVMMSDTDLAISRLEELRDLGVRLAMDDFGTGYSSLSYLSRFPVDVLKMDRSFLNAGASPESSGLASAVIAIGETLALDVVAEGIELNEQWLTLRSLGCERGQGFLFAKPMPAAETLDALRNWSDRVLTDYSSASEPLDEAEPLAGAELPATDAP